MTLTAVRLLAPHLTAENHEGVLARARNKRLEDIQALVAELAPRPDVPATVRKLPVPKTAGPVWRDRPAPPTASPDVSPAIDHDDVGQDGVALQAPLPHHPRHRPIVQALAPKRYRVQFTIGQEAHDDLRTVQALLRREIPNGDPADIFERALALLRKEVEKTKLGKTAEPRKKGNARREGRAYENRIRLETDNPQAQDPSHDRPPERDGHTRAPSRHIPSAVKRVVWFRDRGQCAFVSAKGRRCAERCFLELHHIQPYALEGSATAGNIALRCRRHNQYESELIFGRRGTAPGRLALKRPTF